MIEAEGDSPEEGGFFIFFPSGLTKTVAWRSAKPISPTFDAAKQYVTKVLEELLKAGHEHDASSTNWVSVIAAVQKIISDFNDRVRMAIGAQIRREVESKERAQLQRQREREGGGPNLTFIPGPQHDPAFTMPAYHEPPPPPPPPPPSSDTGGGDFGGGGASGDY